MGARAYTKIKDCTFGANENVIEIGSERGEGSTTYLNEFCVKNNLNFYSIDIYPQIDIAIKADGAEWLRNFDGEIAFCYLDNFDYIFPCIEEAEFVKEQISLYSNLGYLMNNENSENEHLKQSMLVHQKSRIGTEILIDDTWITPNGFRGKGARAVPFLLENGYELLNEIYSGEEKDEPNDKWYAHLKRVK